MKQRTIWILSAVVSITFIALLTMQVRYIKDIVSFKKEQFDESVQKALYQTSRNLELNETLHYLQEDIARSSKSSICVDSFAQGGFVSFTQKTAVLQPSASSKALILRHNTNSIEEATKIIRETFKNRYIYQKALVDEVVYNIIQTASDRPLKNRMNFKQFDQDLRTELQNNGINLEYHFLITTQNGKEVYRCPDFSSEGMSYSYSEVLFRNDPREKIGLVTIHFPDMASYLYSSIRFLIPALIFTVVLIFIFLFTLVMIYRQKKYTEMKNDFINNMTHELKTPISSISLASQMLSDDSVPKSPAMIKHISGVVSDETKRLRYLVEKVLQLSLFERQKAIFKRQELNLNEMVESIANTFVLRVEHTGGYISPTLEAENATISVDETHFSNVIFNLFDNAIKYKKPDMPINIEVKTWNDEKYVHLAISDNGIGIKKENQKRIFEQFYRVHTGNVHDVKGFGLGLAYVKAIVDMHKGLITVDSNKNGTTFKISMPLV